MYIYLPIFSSGEGEVSLDPDIVSKFSMLISKLNACVNHLEQFPIKVGEYNKSIKHLIDFY